MHVMLRHTRDTTWQSFDMMKVWILTSLVTSVSATTTRRGRLVLRRRLQVGVALGAAHRILFDRLHRNRDGFGSIVLVSCSAPKKILSVRTLGQTAAKPSVEKGSFERPYRGRQRDSERSLAAIDSSALHRGHIRRPGRGGTVG